MEAAHVRWEAHRYLAMGLAHPKTNVDLPPGAWATRVELRPCGPTAIGSGAGSYRAFGCGIVPGMTRPRAFGLVFFDDCRLWSMAPVGDTVSRDSL